jgi:hypothetical protein
MDGFPDPRNGNESQRKSFQQTKWTPRKLVYDRVAANSKDSGDSMVMRRLFTLLFTDRHGTSNFETVAQARNKKMRLCR